jgi:hypothetical protein
MDYIASTQAWLKTVVIGLNVCPFARREVERGSVKFELETSTDVATCLENLILQCECLDQDDNIETTLLVYANAFSEFDDYLDFVAIAQDLLEAEHYEGVYQLATFHPHYCFQGATEDDAANFTNRSPFPMLHLLRESSLTEALAHYPNPDTIPVNNITLMRQIGLGTLQATLATCYV